MYCNIAYIFYKSGSRLDDHGKMWVPRQAKPLENPCLMGPGPPDCVALKTRVHSAHFVFYRRKCFAGHGHKLKLASTHRIQTENQNICLIFKMLIFYIHTIVKVGMKSL